MRLPELLPLRRARQGTRGGGIDGVRVASLLLRHRRTTRAPPARTRSQEQDGDGVVGELERSRWRTGDGDGRPAAGWGDVRRRRRLGLGVASLFLCFRWRLGLGERTDRSRGAGCGCAACPSNASCAAASGAPGPWAASRSARSGRLKTGPDRVCYRADFLSSDRPKFPSGLDRTVRSLTGHERAEKPARHVQAEARG
jgi:hypothetical protein